MHRKKLHFDDLASEADFSRTMLVERSQKKYKALLLLIEKRKDDNQKEGRKGKQNKKEDNRNEE